MTPPPPSGFRTVNKSNVLLAYGWEDRIEFINTYVVVVVEVDVAGVGGMNCAEDICISAETCAHTCLANA